MKRVALFEYSQRKQADKKASRAFDVAKKHPISSSPSKKSSKSRRAEKPSTGRGSAPAEPADASHSLGEDTSRLIGWLPGGWLASRLDSSTAAI